jgi:hypothetical protein
MIRRMARSKNTKLLANIDCSGGGQVWVEGHILYIGHMRHPVRTTIVDVADPTHPTVLARIEMPPGWHSHKVRVADDIMIAPREIAFYEPDPRGARRRPRPTMSPPTSVASAI